MKVICGTGHRPDKLGGYSDAAFNILIKVAENWLSRHKPKLVISGMAMGWDMALAQASINLNIPFLAAVPFAGQERLWSPKIKAYYQYLISKAVKVVIVSEGEYTIQKMQIRNEWMVNNSDLVLTIFDGTKGGTKNCIEYAKSKSKPIVNLFEKYRELTCII